LLFCVLFVCKCVLYCCHRVATKCVLYCCHRVATQMQLKNISTHTRTIRLTGYVARMEGKKMYTTCWIGKRKKGIRLENLGLSARY
jgi:hypothetical protein